MGSFYNFSANSKGLPIEIDNKVLCVKITHPHRVTVANQVEETNKEVKEQISLVEIGRTLLVIFIFYSIYYAISWSSTGFNRTLTGIFIFLVLILISNIFKNIVSIISKYKIPNTKQLKFLIEKVLPWITNGSIPAGLCLAFLTLDISIVRQDFKCLQSALGAVLIPMSFVAISKIRNETVQWRPVVIGLVVQFVVANLAMRWPLGREAIQWIGDKTAEFMSFARFGSTFVFKTIAIEQQNVLFNVLPTLPLFASFVQVLYHLGWIQRIVNVIANIVGTLLRTTAAETTSCCANIILGMCESPILIKPLIGYLTLSEIHAVMVGGCSTTSGALMGILFNFGINPKYVLTASLMAAPVALAFSKLSKFSCFKFDGFDNFF